MLVRDNVTQEYLEFPPYLHSSTTDYHKSYTKDVYRTTFEPSLFTNSNYKAIKMFPTQELVDHLKKHIPLVRKNVQQFGQQMDKLSLTFGSLIVRGFHIDDFLQRFFFVIEKRLRMFFEHLDHKVLQSDANHNVPDDFKFGQMRQYIRDKLIEVSNQLVDKFARKVTPVEYDREILKKIETILRLYDYLKQDQSFSFTIKTTKFDLSLVLQMICDNTITHIDSLQHLMQKLLVVSMKTIKEDTQYQMEGRSPLFLMNKDVVLERFHSILKDKIDYEMNNEDTVYICKSVAARDRRIVFNEFQTQISQQLKQIAPEYYQYSTVKKSEYQQEREQLQRDLNKIFKQWEELKHDENYYLVLEDRINEDNLKSIPLESEKQLHQLQKLNQFSIKASNLQYDATATLKAILDHKDNSKARVEGNLQESIQKAQKYYNEQVPGRNPYSKQIHQFIDELFDDLIKLLNKDPSSYKGIVNRMEQQIQHQMKSKDNPYLQNVQKELIREQQIHSNMQKHTDDEIKRKSDLLNAQVDMMVNNKHQRDLHNEGYHTRPYQPISEGKVKHGSSEDYQASHGYPYAKQYQPTSHEPGKYEKRIQEQNPQQLSRDPYLHSNKGYYVDQVIGPPPKREEILAQNQRPGSSNASKVTTNGNGYMANNKPESRQSEPPQKQKPEPPKKVDPPPKEQPKQQPKQPEPPKKPEPPKEQPKQPEPPKKQEPPKQQQPKQPEPPKKPEPPKEQPKQPEPPKKPEPPKEQPKQPEPPKKPEPPKEQPKQPEPPKKPEPPKEQPKQPEPPKKPEPPKEQPKQPEPPKKPEPPKEQPKQPEPPKKPEPPKEQPKQPEPPKKPEPPKEQPKQPEPPKKPEPPKEQPKQPEPPKKPEPPKEQPKQPEPPKKPEPPKEQPKQPEPPKKPEPPKEQPKQPEPPKKPEPPKEQPKQPEPPKKPEPPKEQPKQPEPPKKPEPPKEQPKQPEPPKKPEPPKEQPKQPEPPKKPEPPKEQPKQPEPPKKPEPPKEQPKQPEPPKKPEPPKEQPKQPEPPKKPEPPKEQPKQPEPPKKPEPPKEQPKYVPPPQRQPQYDDIDNFSDDDGDEDFMAGYQPSKPQQPAQVQKPQPALGKQLGAQEGFSDFDEDDLPGLDQKEMDKLKPGQDEEDAPFEQVQLVTKGNLNLLNTFVKNTKYGKANPVKLDEFNGYDFMIQLFEEFLIQDEAYFVDFEESMLLIDINDKMLQEEDPNQEIGFMMKLINENFQQRTQKPQFGEAQRIYFPFDQNPFLFYMLEKDPIQRIVNIYFEQEPPEELMSDEFQNLIGIFQQLFDCEDYELGQIVIDPQTVQVFDQLGEDAIYLKYMLTIFTILYEVQAGIPEVKVTKDTMERMFWQLHSSTLMFEEMNNDQEALEAHFEGVISSQDKSIGVDIKNVEYSEDGLLQLQKEVDAIKTKFMKDKQTKQHFISIEIASPQGEMKFTFYLHLSRVSQLCFLKLFVLQHYEQMNDNMLGILLAEDGQFSQKVYIDYARHNFQYEYGTVHLGAWMQLITKKNLKPEDAMAVLALSLAPYYALFKKLD